MARHGKFCCRQKDTARDHKDHTQNITNQQLLPSLDSILNSRCLNILRDSSSPANHLLHPLPLGKTLQIHQNSPHKIHGQFLSQSCHHAQLPPENKPLTSVNTCTVCMQCTLSFMQCTDTLYLPWRSVIKGYSGTERMVW